MTSELQRFINMARLARTPIQSAILIAKPALPTAPPAPTLPAGLMDRLRRLSPVGLASRPVELA